MIVIGDSLLEIPMIFQPAANSLLVVARPIPSELPTINACNCTNVSPSSLVVL
jgi:hypothetical protein